MTEKPDGQETAPHLCSKQDPMKLTSQRPSVPVACHSTGGEKSIARRPPRDSHPHSDGRPSRAIPRGHAPSRTHRPTGPRTRPPSPQVDDIMNSGISPYRLDDTPRFWRSQSTTTIFGQKPSILGDAIARNPPRHLLKPPQFPSNSTPFAWQMPAA